MANTTQHMTANELASLPDDGNRRELVDGVVHMMSPAGGRHGRVAGKLLLRIGSHVERYRLGQTFAAETGFLLGRDPDTVRAPDVSFVSHARLGAFADHAGFLPLAPDFVAEVVSPGDSESQVAAKVRDWLEAGTLCVLIVDPQRRVIHEWPAASRPSEYRDGVIDLDDVLPGFKLDVAELFES